jgi:predicted nuclease of predicted toxin-antitoxin system
MRLLVDMNLSPRWVDMLAAAGFEAAHWSMLGPHSAPDVEIMGYARTHDYVVLTSDLDFGTILAATQGDKPSVVQIRADDVNPEAIGSHVVAAVLQVEADLETGALLTVDPDRARLRVLPLLRRSER